MSRILQQAGLRSRWAQDSWLQCTGVISRVWSATHCQACQPKWHRDPLGALVNLLRRASIQSIWQPALSRAFVALRKRPQQGWSVCSCSITLPGSTPPACDTAAWRPTQGALCSHTQHTQQGRLWAAMNRSPQSRSCLPASGTVPRASAEVATLSHD